MQDDTNGHGNLHTLFSSFSLFRNSKNRLNSPTRSGTIDAISGNGSYFTTKYKEHQLVLHDLKHWTAMFKRMALVGLAGLSPQQDVDLLLDPILRDYIKSVEWNGIMWSWESCYNRWSPCCRERMCWWTSDTPDKRDPQAEWNTISILFWATFLSVCVVQRLLDILCLFHHQMIPCVICLTS